MPRHVVQCFLQNAIDVYPSAAVDRKRLPLLLIGYGNSGLSFHVGDVPVESALKSGLIEHNRVQSLGEAPDAFQSSLHGLKNFLQISAQRRAFGGMRSRATQHGA